MPKRVLYVYKRDGTAVQICEDKVGLLVLRQVPYPTWNQHAWQLPRFNSWEDLRDFLRGALDYVEQVIKSVRGKDNESGLHFTIA